MKKRFSKLSRIAAATMGALAFLSIDASAQTGNFENTTAGAVYQVGTNGGVIRLRCATSQVSNNGGTNNIGTSGNPVPGIVEYGRTTAGAQTVAPMYYTNLMMSGVSTKTINDGVYIMGNGYGTPLGGAALYASMTTGNGYFASGGNRTYTGTFHYGGDVAQNIFAEGATAGGDNNYDKLDLFGASQKTIQFVAGANSGNVVVRNDIQMAGTSELRVNDDLSYNTTGNTNSLFAGIVVVADPTTTTEAIQMRSGGAAAAFSSTVTINPYGDFAVGGTGNVTLNGATTVLGNDNVGATSFGRIQVADGAAGDLVVNNSLTIDDGTVTDGQLYLGTGGTTLQVTGTLVNEVPYAQRTNVTFANASTVIYDNPAAQVVMGTLQSNNYANLTIGGGGNKTVDGDIYMRNDLAMAGAANLFMTPDVATPGNTLYRDVTGHAAGQDVTYAVTNNTQYIQGNMKLIGTMVTGRDYTMNNAHTKVAFATVPTTEFGFRVIPGVPLNTLNRNDIDAQIELPRMVRVLWAGGAPTLSALEIGYTDAEIAAAPTTAARESKIKFFEAYDINEAKQKLNGPTGTSYARDEAGNWVRQNYGGTGAPLVAQGVTAAGNNTDVALNSDIVLGAGAVQTIANGRWSDPATWDENVMPAYDDDVLVRHAVWTGNDVAQFGANAYIGPERDYSNGVATNASARNVTIIAVAPGFTNPGLVIDGADTDYANNYKFGITGDLTNLNTGVMSNDPASTLGDLAATPATSIQGLWVRPVNTAIQNVISVGGIINHGGVMNKGIIEICNQ